MRKYIIPIILVLLLIPGYYLFEASHPKTAERFPFMIILVVMDVYLWFSIRKKVATFPGVLKLITRVFYWLPLGAMILFTLVSAFINLNIVDAPLMTYILGVSLVVYFSKLLTVIFFLLADFYSVISYIIRHLKVKRTGQPRQEIHREDRITRGKFIRTLGLATGGLFFSGMVIGMVKWAHDFRVRYVNLRFPKLPFSFNGYRIVQISDLHLGSWASVAPIHDVAEIINELDADIVLFTGDLVNYSTPEAFRFREALGEIRSRNGIYAILGNHDYGEYVTWPDEDSKNRNMQQLYDFFDELGWKLLRNENAILESGEDRLALIGVENWSASHRFPKLGDLPKAMQGTEGVPVKILMSHDPTHFEHQVSKDFPEIDLTLSGHTHGFQFGVELKRIKWSLAQYVYKYWAGLYEVQKRGNSQYLYVNRGLGMIGYPGRVGILPEITLITLEA